MLHIGKKKVSIWETPEPEIPPHHKVRSLKLLHAYYGSLKTSR